MVHLQIRQVPKRMNPLAYLLLILLITGCSAPTAPPLSFSKEQAIARATQDAKQSVPEVTTTFANAEWVSTARTVDQVLSEADLVVRARVSEAPVTRVLRNELPVLDANGKVTGYKTDEMLFSDTVFDILEVFSGKAPSKITVMQTGGTSPDTHPSRIEVRDDPLYHLGEEYVLFLVDISGDAVQAPGRVLYRTVSPFGRYRIEGESVLSYGENAKSFGLPATMGELVEQIKRER